MNKQAWLQSVAVATLIGAVCSTGPAMAMSLQEAAQLAVKTNPQVTAIADDRLAVDQELRQGQALYFPVVDMSSDLGGEYSNSPTTLDNGHKNGVTLFRSDVSVTVSQLLFDGFFADNEVAKQKARVRSAAYRVLETAEDVALQAVQAYLDVLRQRARVELAEENVQTHRGRLAQVQQKATAGAGNVADVHQTEARLSTAESELVEAQGNLRDAENNFLKVVGQAPDTLSRPPIPLDLMPLDLDTAVKAALTSSPTLQLSRADIEAADALAQEQYAGFYPDVRLQLSAGQEHNNGGVVADNYDATALIVMKWNLYRGGGDIARVQEFKHRLSEAQDSYVDNERKISEETRISWNSVSTSHQNVIILQKTVLANTQTRDAYRQQFDIGQRGLLDLLNADNELYLSQDNLVTATYAEIFARYRLLAVAGGLEKALSVAPPEQAAVPVDQ
jgi:outer membrane protein, adhesin transport system